MPGLKGSRMPVSKIKTKKIAVYTRILAVLCLLLAVPPLFASDEEDVLEKMQQRYASVKTISGSFRQLFRDPGIERTDWSGEFCIKKPDKMKWQYRLPEKKTFVASKGKNRIYNPQDNQVTEWSEDLEDTPFRFLVGGGDIKKSFFIKPGGLEYSKRFERAQSVRLEPKREMGYSFLNLEIDPESFDLKRLIVREKDGSTNEYIFTNIKTGQQIDDKEFRLDLPKGVEVLEVEYD